MTLSIIIVNYRSWSFLEDCLSGLMSDPQAGDWQTIVVDNNSGDGEFENFSRRFDRVNFISNNRNGGFAFGCNTGAGIARGESLLFLNPDVMVQVKFFIELARSVYFTNDKRAAAKKELNLHLGSEIIEEKSYQDYA